jgi:hypothetical protein
VGAQPRNRQRNPIELELRPLVQLKEAAFELSGGFCARGRVDADVDDHQLDAAAVNQRRRQPELRADLPPSALG